MKRLGTHGASVLLAGAIWIVPAAALYSQGADRPLQSGAAQDRVAKEVRHELVMLPYYLFPA